MHDAEADVRLPRGPRREGNEASAFGGYKATRHSNLAPEVVCQTYGGKNHAIWNAIGHYGIGKINYNGFLLLEFNLEFNLAICNTFFRLKLKHKVTWTHPRSKHGPMVDYIITRKGNIGDASIVRVIRSTECGTDHFMVRGKFMFRIRKKSRMTGVQAPERIDVAKLEHPDSREALSDAFDSLRFDSSWSNFREQVYSVSVDVFGLTRKQHRD